MACTHIAGCPLFPYLNASLASWRETYCDSTTQWHDCARYQLSSEGRPVPIALLPNGKLPVALIPNLSAAESLELATSMGPPGCGVSPGPAGREQERVPATSVAEVTQDLFRPAPRPQPARAPLTDYFFAAGRRQPVQISRWARILQWLRTPA